MLVIFCGDDITTSRNKFSQYKNDRVEVGFESIELLSANLTSELQELSSSLSLFNDRKLLYAEGVLKDKKLRDFLKNFQDDPIEIVIFEPVLSERELKFVYDKARFVSSKLPSSLFSLLDTLTPGNLQKVFREMHDVVSPDNELLVLYLIKGRIKDLLLLKSNNLEGSRLKPWQIGKLKSQAQAWDTNKLISCYENLFKIEVNVKTSGSVFSVHQALEMLFCFYI